MHTLKNKEATVSRRVPIAAAALAGLIAASLASASATVSAQTAVNGPYLGSYTAKVTFDDAVEKGDARMAGRYTLVLRRDGTYRASNPLDGPTIRGRFTPLPRQRLRFRDDEGWSCERGGFERPEGGTYRWSLEGRRLTFTRVSEGPCTGRTQTLTYPVWIRR